jgi:hypothetical protein
MSRVYLFDGTNTDHWTERDGVTPITWKVEDGAMTVVEHDIVSKETFGDAHIHVEWREPDMPDCVGQRKGNSGVYIQGCYELQVLDSYGEPEIKSNHCGGFYMLYCPRVNACRPALEWQTYDIYFRAPRFNEAGEVTENARATILQNGICIHNNIELYDTTHGGVGREKVAKGPILLQDHYHDPVSYRNIWVEEY